MFCSDRNYTLLASAAVLAVSVATSGCSSSISYRGTTSEPAVSSDECDLILLDSTSSAPPDTAKLGTLAIGDTGFSVNCGSDAVRRTLEREACRRGANLVRIRTWNPPDAWSTCVRLTADLYELGAQDWENVGYTESDFRAHIDDQLKSRVMHSVEGVWGDPGGRFEIGLIRDNVNAGRDFYAFVIESERDWWHPGDVKAKLERTAHRGFFMGTWFDDAKAPRKATFYINDVGLLAVNLTDVEPGEELLLVKKYPFSADEQRQGGGGVVTTPASNERIVGTCFAISDDGVLVTNYHVVQDRKEVFVGLGSGSVVPASVISVDPSNDLAILKAVARTDDYLGIKSSKTVTSGVPVFTFGFPVTDILGAEVKYTDGAISSTQGLGGAANLFQISVPLQPGNSGGPLVGFDGQVIGVVSATAAVAGFYEASGALPQNVSWAVKSDYVSLLAEGLPPRAPVADSPFKAVEMVRKAVCSVRY